MSAGTADCVSDRLHENASDSPRSSGHVTATGDEVVTVRLLLREIETILHHSENGASGGSSVREAREILAAILQTSPGDVSRRSDEVMTPAVRALATEAGVRHSRGEPLAYCVGSAAFRHLVLGVDRRVLVPRPETEVVVEEALKAVAGFPGGIAVDIGTGSGAIALSLATEGRFDRVIATDVSRDALAVARENAERLLGDGAPVSFMMGADLEPLVGIQARVLVSNPPYIAFEEAGSLPASVREWEPALALFAERNGMARYEALVAGAPDHLEPNGWLVLEVDSRRASQTADLARRDGRYADIRLVKDLTGRDRVLVARVGITAK